MNELKIIIIRIFRIISRIFCIFPIDNKKLIFEAYMGKQYACNPKYISQYIADHSDDYTILWVYYKTKLPCDFKQIKRNTLSYFYHMLTAKTIVINSGNNKLLLFRPEQIMINTWHGGGAYKKTPEIEKKKKKKILKYRDNDFFLSSCERATEYVIRDGQCFDKKVLNTGFPRNDILLNYDPSLIKQVKTKLSVIGKKCVLYAPTYREDTSITEFELDYTRLISNLKRRFDGDWIILKRGHYHMKNGNCRRKCSIVDVSKYPDMQELLIAADVLITDYSSSIWDYSFLNRPAFLYATDLDDYINQRSFYTDIHEWPYSLSQNNDELEYNIINYDHQKCLDAIARHHKMMGSYETGRASESVYQFIRNYSE